MFDYDKYKQLQIIYCRTKSKRIKKKQHIRAMELRKEFK